MSRSKTILITGVTGGVGSAVARRFLSAGYNVVGLFFNNQKAAKELSKFASNAGANFHAIKLNLAKKNQYGRILGKYFVDFGLDGIIFCAASGVHNPISRLTQKDLKWTFEVNFFSVHSLIFDLNPFLNKGATITGLLSGGTRHYIPNYGAIASSKAALEFLLLYCIVELKNKRVRVNMIRPGFMHTGAVKSVPTLKKLRKQFLQKTPSQKLTTEEDIAELVIFLNSKGSEQINGQIISVDGGREFVFY